MQGGINYAFNALPIANVQNLPLGVYTNSTSMATISTDATQAANLSGLLLTDVNTGITTDLLTSNYSFTANAGTNNARFLISAQRTSTENVKISTELPYCSIIAGKLLINNLQSKSKILVFDAFGRFIASEIANNTSLEMQLPAKGVYIIQIIDDNSTICQKVICK